MKSTEGSLLIVGGAGGVGSIATQLARQLTRLKIIATASRPETVQWCQRMGAHHVIDHRQPLAKQVKDNCAGRSELCARPDQDWKTISTSSSRPWHRKARWP